MYSSTLLDRPSRTGCWKQLDFAESHADESLFKLRYSSDLGIAAHAVMQYVIERRAETEADIRKTAEEVAITLIGKGRTFRGHDCPPLPPNDVYAGVDIAVEYLLANPVDYSAETLIVEQEAQHPTLPYTALIDLLTVAEEGDDETTYRIARTSDWKTSWQAGADELGTLQRWGQAVNVWRNFEGIDIIRMEIVNLRTWVPYNRDLWLDNPDDLAELVRWESRIGELCQIADAVKNAEGKRPAAPGAGCVDCPWVHLCEEASPLAEIEQPATKLATLEAARKTLIESIKAKDPELPIRITGGEVGFHEQTTRAFRKGKEGQLLSDWLSATATEIPEDTFPVIASLVAALKPGKGNLDALAKVLYPEKKKGIKQVRDEYVAWLTHEVKQSRFGVWSEHQPNAKNDSGAS